MKSKKILVEFADQNVAVDSLKITNTYAGILEGSPAVASKWILKRETENASNVVDICQKVIIPEQTQSLPLYRYEMVIKHYAPKEQPKYDGDDDWYFLKLIWFDYAPDPEVSLRDYIGSITRPMKFFDVCEKLTEDQKDYWC